MKNRYYSTLFRVVGFCFIVACGAVIWPDPGNGQSSRRSGSIGGRVVTEDGQPVEGATVNCASAENITAMRMSTTDAEGNFSFTGLSPAVYRLLAFAPGLVSMPMFGGEGVIARIGETHTMALVRGGVVTGRVTNSAGESVVAVQVGAIRVRDGEGKPVRTAGAIRARQTDDRGIYRLYGLPAGTYLIVANLSTGMGFQSSAYDQQVPTFFPSSNRDSATEISVQTGAEVSGIDIRYRDIRGHSINGSVDGVTGSASVQLELRAGGSVVSTTLAFAREPGAARTFAINGVPDGDYDLIGSAVGGIEEAFVTAPRRITVRGADVVGVKLTMTPLASIAGKVVIEAGNIPEDCVKGRESVVTEIMVRAQFDGKAADADALVISAFRLLDAVKPGGEFKVNNLVAGSHWLYAELPGENWYIKSATMPGPGAARKPIDLGRTTLSLKAGERAAGVTVTVAEGAAQLTGKITGERVGRGRWRIHLVPVDAAQAGNTLVYYEAVVGGDAGFMLEHLAPGKYWVLARAWPEDQSTELTVRRAAWDTAERAKLRKEAEAAKQEVELNACQRIKDAEVSLK